MKIVFEGTKEQIENLKLLLRIENNYRGQDNSLPRLKEDYFSLWFSRGDIKSHADDLGIDIDENDIDNVIKYFASKGDASVGINWDSIEEAINYVKEM